MGKKLLATGNGRCNLTNLDMSPAHYRGDPDLLKTVLGGFMPEDARAFFRTLGLFTCADDSGRVYPLSGQAASVLDALRLSAQENGTELRAGAPVTAVEPVRSDFCIRQGDSRTTVSRVILACGGRAASACTGYEIAGRLGIPVTPLAPALCPVPVRESSLRALKGLRVRAEVGAVHRGRTIARESGEVQFAEHALSGICVFNLAGVVREHPGCVLSLDLLPEERNAQKLVRELVRAIPRRPAEGLLAGLVPGRIGTTIMRACFEGSLHTEAEELPEETLCRIADTLKDWRFTPAGTPAWESAQVTHGGIPAGELDARSLEIRRVPGLYAVGEIVDVDGDCGGYNLHWAWASAHAAARAVLGGKTL